LLLIYDIMNDMMYDVTLYHEMCCMLYGHVLSSAPYESTIQMQTQR